MDDESVDRGSAERRPDPSATTGVKRIELTPEVVRIYVGQEIGDMISAGRRFSPEPTPLRVWFTYTGLESYADVRVRTWEAEGEHHVAVLDPQSGDETYAFILEYRPRAAPTVAESTDGQ